MLSVHEVVVESSLHGTEVTCPEASLDMAGSMACNASFPLTQVGLQHVISRVDRMNEFERSERTTHMALVHSAVAAAGNTGQGKT